jgi:rhomboid protease GluP
MANDDEQRTPSQDDDAWIERVVGLASHLGFHPMRTRWKLIRWQDRRRKRARLREQRSLRVAYAHKTCPECTAVHDRNEVICTRCGAKLGSRRLQVLQRLGLGMPSALSTSTLLAIAILAAYARVWVAAGGGLGSPGGSLLVDFGGRWPPAMADEPWRLVTAMFLHAGLWHLGFNCLAIGSVGPRIEEAYGRPTMIGLFIATGALANLGALEVGRLAVGVGASGGVMGLIGAAAAYGHRLGTSHGRGLRDAMLRWAVYTFVFGFALGADNWAHLFGAIVGAAFGLAVPPSRWGRPGLVALRLALGGVGVVATVGALAIICTRTPSPPREPPPVRDPRAIMAGAVEVCTKLHAGRTAEAIAEAALLEITPPAGQSAEQVVTTMCVQLQQLRDDCKTGVIKPEAGSLEEDRAQCRDYGDLLDRLPRRAAPASASAGAGSGR